MKQLFFVSTLFQVVNVVAGIEAGQYDSGFLPYGAVPPGTKDADSWRTNAGRRADDHFPEITERILVVSNNGQIPELTVPIQDIEETKGLFTRFDRVVDLNQMLEPLSPVSWNPSEKDLPVWERFIRSHWELGNEELELVLESPQTNPARAFARLFHEASIRIHADGLMGYGPTRTSMELTTGQRMTSIHYLPFVRDLYPRLLNEYDIVPVELNLDTFKSTVDELVDSYSVVLEQHLGHLKNASTALLVGQYLAQLSLLSADEEFELHVGMLSEAKSRGASTVVFKPHPTAVPTTLLRIKRAAEELELDFVIFDQPIIAEVVLAWLQPVAVIGCFSTSLAVAHAVYGIESIAIGTEKMLEAITPFENSNRIPVTIADAVFGKNSESELREGGDQLQNLIDSVAYAMQHQVMSAYRDITVEFLNAAVGSTRMKYFKKRRLSALDLPGGLPPRPKSPRTRLAKRIVGKGKQVIKKLQPSSLSRPRR